MSDKAQWAYNAISAIEAEYSNENLHPSKEDEREVRMDHILSQLTDDEYEDYLEIVMDKEGIDEDDEDDEDDEWV